MNKNGEIRPRNENIDVMRGLGIILVVYAHACLPGSILIEYFHMPLFFFISGYLFRSAKIVKTLKKYYLPFVGIQFIMIPFRNLFYSFGVEQSPFSSFRDIISYCVSVLLFDIRSTALSQLWFLFILTIDYLAYYLIQLIFKKDIEKLIAGIIICIIAWYLPHIAYSNTYPIQMGAIGLFYYIFGHFISKCSIKEKSMTKLSYILPGMGGLTYIVLYFVGFRSGYRGVEFSNYWLSFIVALIGIFLTWLISQFVLKINIVKNFFTMCGRSSLIIYLLHPLMFDCFGIIMIRNSIWEKQSNWIILNRDGIWPYISFAIGVICPFIISYFLNKAKNKLKSRD